MPQANMSFSITTPDWSTLSDPVKSLINFFIKDSKLFFHGDFDETTHTLTSLYSCIRTQNRLITEMIGDSDGFGSQDSVELYIPYTVDTAASPATYPVHTQGNLDIPEIPTTLIEKESRLRLYWVEKESEVDPETYEETTWRQVNVSHNSSTQEPVLPIENVRVLITPKIGTSTNTNPDVTLDLVTEANPDLSLSITAPHPLESDYQLRTSSLFLDDGEGNVAENVYYKVGIVPFDKQYPKWGNSAPVNTPSTLNGLKSTILTSRIFINTDATYMVGTSTYMSFMGVDFSVGSPWESDYEFWDSKVPLSFIIPIQDNNKFIGLIYARMYKQDGTEVDPTVVSGYDLKLYYKSSEDDPNPQPISSSDVATQPVIFTDQNLDGGWVQSPTNE